MKARKTANPASAQMSKGFNKKSKNTSILQDHKKDTDTALTTSAAQKRKTKNSSASPGENCLQKRGKGMLPGRGEHFEHACHDLRLVFSNIEGSYAHQKGSFGSPTRSSIFETILSPVFSLFKGSNGEVSNSCTGNGAKVEHVFRSEEQPEAVISDIESNCPELGLNNRLLASCTLITVASEELSIENADTSFSGDVNYIPLSWHTDNMANIFSASDGDIINSHVTFDMGDNCIGWSLTNERDMPQHVEHFEEHIFESDGTSLYLAVQQSRCLDGNHVNETVVDEAEFQDFDPYLFIKQLPDLSEVVSPCCPNLLPRQTWHYPRMTLVLDLDETLVHSTLEKCDNADFTFPVKFNHQEHTVYVRCRPYLQDFLERVAQLFEIIVFTASQCIYAEQLLNILDPKRKLIQHRVYRDSCVFVEGNYLKDLTILGRDLAKVAIVDNSPQAFGFQVENGIPIESWFDDRTDNQLLELLPFLETLAGKDDVRPEIAKKYNPCQRTDAGMILPFAATNQGDPFDRNP